MEVRTIGRGPIIRDTQGKATPRPAEIVDLINAHEAERRPAVDASKKALEEAKVKAKALRAEAKQLQGEPRKQKLAEAKDLVEKATEKVDEAVGLFLANLERISGAEGRRLLLKAVGQPFDSADAGHAVVAAANATLWVVRFGYPTHKAGEAWLRDVPKDNKVIFNFICSPSAHDSRPFPGEDKLEKKVDEWDRMEHWFEDYARTNQYKVDVHAEMPDGTKVPVHSAQFGVKNPPEYATMSADIPIDVSKYKGCVLVFAGSAIGSAGPYGYPETRVTRVRIP